jgi:hypothetical protein
VQEFSEKENAAGKVSHQGSPSLWRWRAGRGCWLDADTARVGMERDWRAEPTCQIGIRVKKGWLLCLDGDSNSTSAGAGQSA